MVLPMPQSVAPDRAVPGEAYLEHAHSVEQRQNIDEKEEELDEKF